MLLGVDAADPDPDHLMPVVEIPVTLAGLSPHNIANVLAATAAAFALGLPREAVVEGLRTFVPDAEHNPGRMNVFDLGGVVVILDFAHNPEGLEALLRVADGLRMPGQAVRLALSGAGDRRDEDLTQLGALAAQQADDVLAVRSEQYLRGRTLEEVQGLFQEGAASVGHADFATADGEVHGPGDPGRALLPGDVVAFMCHGERTRRLRSGWPSARGRADVAGGVAAARRRGSRPRLERRRRGRDPVGQPCAPGWATCDRCSSSSSTSPCLSTQITRMSPGLASVSACRTDSSSSSTISVDRQRAPSAMAVRTPSATRAEVSPRSRPRRAASSRTMIASKCCGRHRAQLAHVVVAPVAGRGDDADAPVPFQLGAGVAALGQPVDEVAERAHAVGVVAVVDEDGDTVDVELVEPAGGEVVRRRERAQALPDVVERGAGRERSPGGSHRVGDVEPGLAPERRGQQVGPGERHGATPVPDHDALAELAALQDHGPAAARQ